MTTSDVQARAEQLRGSRQPFVEATVVRAERPTSAKPGDTALVLSDGTIVGFVGGECAQASVTAQALAVLEAAEPLLLRITPSPSPETEAEAAPQSGVATVHNPCLSGGTLEIFLEPALPPPLLVIHGDAPIARAVARLAEDLGYATVPWTGDALPTDAIAVVVASHGRDEPALLTAAVETGVPYVGLVASPRRGAAVVSALDLSDEQRARIRTPAGLDINARTPGEVALSILAEIVPILPHRSTSDAGAPRSAPVGGRPTATDPVCGMAVATVDASLHVDHGGRRYWFCGSGCRNAFVADPGAFLSS